MLLHNINDQTVGANPARKKFKKKKKKKICTPLKTTVKIVRRSMLKQTSQLEDQLIQYWHRIYTLEDQLKDINNNKNTKLGATRLLAIHRNDTTTLEKIYSI